MDEPRADAFPLAARSVVRGRVRWDAPALHRAPRLAAEVERLLLERPGIEGVRANPLTGRLLVLHAANLPLSRLDREIRTVAREALVRLRGQPLRDTRLPHPSTELMRTVVVGGGALAMGGAVSLAAGSVAPLMVAGSVFALVLAVNEVTRVVGTQGAVSATTSRRVLTLARPFRRRILLAAGLGAASVLSSMARVFFMGSAITALTRRGKGSGFAFRMVVLSGIGLLSNALHASLEYAATVQWRRLSDDARHHLRLEAYAHLQILEVSSIERRRHGELLGVLGEDVQRIQGLFQAAWDLFRMAVRVIPSCLIYIFVAPRVAWVTLSFVPVILRFSTSLYRRTLPLQRSAVESQALLMSHLSESLTGFETIKSYTLEKYQWERVRDLGRKVLRESARATSLSSAFSPSLEVLVMLGTIATLAGAALFAGPETSSGTYSILLMLTGQLYWPLADLGKGANELQRALVSLDRVYDLLEEEVPERSGSRRLDPREVGGDFLVDDVVFGYEPEIPVLHGVRMRFAQGRTTAIVGPTGSGKSTLAKLLLRFYEAQEGAVRLDGVDIRELAVRDLRRSVALASQTPFLFFGSIRENIELGDPGAPLPAVQQAARWAHASRFIEALPEGYESQVAEHGQKLSGGERQRISLARALLKNGPVLLLDEATSQVDNQTEAAITASLREVRKDRTTILIAHRLSAVRDADYIYVLDHGRVVEEGIHDDLVRLGGTYAALWKLQSGPSRES